ncbi:hypothetical protein DSECCO2_598820 [anaerobic digester metagenome]
MLKGEYKNVKRKFLLSLLVLALVLGLFTGCEPVPTLPGIVNTQSSHMPKQLDPDKFSASQAVA